MSNSELVGKVQTVLGPIAAEDLGITLPHEHLLCDVSVHFTEPSESSARERAHRPITMEDLSWIRYRLWQSFDNCRLLNEGEAISEVLRYKRAGGSTIVDCTPKGIAPDPMGLARIARATGINVIMASGYYIGKSLPVEMDSRTEYEIAEEMVREITVGIGDTGICAGIIKFSGSWPMLENERKILHAAASVQKRTGVPLMIHPGLRPDPNIATPLEIIEVLSNAGADMSRVVMGHLDIRLPRGNPEDRRRLAQTGCYIEYDTFGWEGYHPVLSVDVPSDSVRLNELIQLISDGYLNQILISHDIGYKFRLAKFGGHGYAHILENVVPLMRAKGISKEHIDTILMENPKRLLQFV